MDPHGSELMFARLEFDLDNERKAVAYCEKSLTFDPKWKHMWIQALKHRSRVRELEVVIAELELTECEF